jgi:hypothetical protein
MNIFERYEVIDSLHEQVPTTWKINATAKDEVEVKAVDRHSGEAVHTWTLESREDYQSQRDDIVATGQQWSAERREM